MEEMEMSVKWIVGIMGSIMTAVVVGMMIGAGSTATGDILDNDRVGCGTLPGTDHPTTPTESGSTGWAKICLKNDDRTQFLYDNLHAVPDRTCRGGDSSRC